MPCVFTCPSLGITMVAVKQLKLGVGWCWASVPGQLCQQALLSVQSFIIFQQGLPTAWYGCCLFIYMYFNETSRARAWSTAGAMVSRSKRPADLSDGSCLNVLASFLHMWFVGFAATASDAGWSLRAGSLSVLSVSFLLLWFLFLLFFWWRWSVCLFTDCRYVSLWLGLRAVLLFCALEAVFSSVFAAFMVCSSGEGETFLRS